MGTSPGAPLFPVGGPVETDDLVGREEFIVALVRRLDDGQSVVLAAPRRMGKTSVVDEALRRLGAQGCYTARVDLFAVTSRAELAEELADRCLENRTGLRRSIRAVREFARSAAGVFRPSVTIQDVELSLSLAREDADEHQLLRDALRLPQELARQDRKRLVIAWDEFQDVTRLDERRSGETLRLLRAELQRQSLVSHVFLGSQESVLRNIFGSPSHAFYRFALELPFPPPPGPADWLPYLRRKLESRDMTIADGDATRLVELSGGHPMDTMELAAAAYYVALKAGAHAITSTVIDVAYERAMAELARSFDEVWAELGTRGDARLVARRIATGQTVSRGAAGPRLHPQQAAKGLALLQQKGIIVRRGRGRYAFVEPMVAEYLRRLRA